jgi:lysophospholipase L1-like esterase/uncharacterized protein YigE (DUF2233 family)
VNGDGLEDIVGFADEGTYVSLSTGAGFGSPRKFIDGFGYNAGWRVESHPRFLADVDGDGRKDVVGFANEGAYVSLSTGDAFTPPARWVAEFGLNQGWRVDMHPRFLVDVNGDRRADIVGLASDGTYVSLSNGSRFFPAAKWSEHFGDNEGWRISRHPRFVDSVARNGVHNVVGFADAGIVTDALSWKTIIPENGDFSHTSRDTQDTRSSFAELTLNTSATQMAVGWASGTAAGVPWRPYSQIEVTIPGTSYRTVLMANATGVQSDEVANMPAGPKTVVIREGLQIESGGTWLTNQVLYVAVHGEAQVIPPSAPAHHVLAVGDSIANGSYATNPNHEGWNLRLRDRRAESWDVFGAGSLEFRTVAGSPESRESLARQLVERRMNGTVTNSLWFAMGTNDYLKSGSTQWSAGNFASAVADFCQRVHAKAPSVTIYVQTPILMNPDGGLSDWRKAEAEALRGLPYVTVVDGEGLVASTDLGSDNIHPTSLGHERYAAMVEAILER